MAQPTKTPGVPVAVVQATMAVPVELPITTTAPATPVQVEAVPLTQVAFLLPPILAVFALATARSSSPGKLKLFYHEKAGASAPAFSFWLKGNLSKDSHFHPSKLHGENPVYL
jgi:hypothetical protein